MFPQFAFLYSCRLEAPAFYYAFLTPICAILLANTVLLLKCVHKLRTTINTSRQYSLAEKKSGTTAKAALGLTVLLGITWLLGIPMMDDATLAFQYIFAILNTLQGLAIFLFQIASKKEFQKQWVESLKFRFKRTPDSSSTLPSNSFTAGTLFSTLRRSLPKKLVISKTRAKASTSSVPVGTDIDDTWPLSSTTSSPMEMFPLSEFSATKSFGSDEDLLYWGGLSRFIPPSEQKEILLYTRDLQRSSHGHLSCNLFVSMSFLQHLLVFFLLKFFSLREDVCMI